MKQCRRYAYRSLTIGIALLAACDMTLIQNPAIPTIFSSAPRTDGAFEAGTHQPTGRHLVQETPQAGISIETPAPTPTASHSATPLPLPTPESSEIPASLPTTYPSSTPTPSPQPTPTPTPIPTLRPTPTPTPTPTPLHTFTRIEEDTRFEEYELPTFGSGIGPPGIVLQNDQTYNTAYISQISVDHRRGEIIGLWVNYDRIAYLLEYNLICNDPNNNNCSQWPAWFVYNPETDRWNFNKELNSNGKILTGKDEFGMRFDRSYIWWFLNMHYQTTANQGNGLVLRIDLTSNQFWILHMNDMPFDANGTPNAEGKTPGIPYPPVIYAPNGWVDPLFLGLGSITTRNALTYSPHGLYFFESEYPDWKLRIHFYSFEVPVERRAWTTKTFLLRAGQFRGNPIAQNVEPYVAYSALDDHLYFIRRNWTMSSNFTIRSLARISHQDATTP